MFELDAIVGFALGVAAGFTPSKVYAPWNEIKERRVQRQAEKQAEREDRQAEREHREQMQKLNNERDVIKHGMDRSCTLVKKRESCYTPKSG